jgi:ubiquinone/menaquinone biosynthesis C-methylase UbiE
MRDQAQLQTEDEIQAAYAPRATATEYDRQVAAAARCLSSLECRRILEIAPGPGRVTRDLPTDKDLVCLEFNQAMINEGRPRCRPSVSWVRGNAFELPFDCRFDLVYSFRFIRHFHQADRRRIYAQVKRVLRPGGWLVFDAVNARVSAPLRAANPQAYPIYDKLYPGDDELRDELAQAGFDVLQAAGVQRWYAAQYRAQVLLGPRSRWLCRMAIRALERLSWGQPLEWIVTCRRA